MSKAIPILLTFAFLLSVSASEAETFALADGRNITGVYDAETSRLTVSGPMRLVLTIAPDSIVSRRPAEAKELAGEPALTGEQKQLRQRTAMETSVRLLKQRGKELDRLLANARSRKEEQLVFLAENDQAIAAGATAWDAAERERAALESEIQDLEHEIAVAGLRIETRTTEKRDETDADDQSTLEKKTTCTVYQQSLPTAVARVRALKRELAGHERRRTALEQQARKLSARRADIEEEIDGIDKRIAAMEAEQAEVAQASEEYRKRLAEYQPAEAVL